jgi:alpha-tubulin suppressor-like RCC1 family protein
VPFARPVTGGYHSCALTAAGIAYCWGQNFVGQVGDGTTVHQPLPVSVADGHTFSTLSAGLANQVTCGVVAAGQAYCWGWNIEGQLGNGTFTDQSVPAIVAGGLAFAGVSTGAAHTCGWTANNAYCWGRNPTGQLGTGGTTPSGVPLPVANSDGFRDLTAGGDHTCARDRFGAAFCWGANAGGQLGDGTNTQRLTPTRVLLPIN